MKLHGAPQRRHFPPGLDHRETSRKLNQMRGSVSCAHSERHAMQDLGVACPRAMRPALSDMKRTYTNPTWRQRKGTSM